MIAVPLPGPLDDEPLLPVAEARAQLDAAVAGIHLGDYDRQVIDRFKGGESTLAAAVASLLRRAHEAGVAAGRAEQIEELPAVARLTLHVDRLEAGLDAVQTRLTAVLAALETAATDEDTDLRTAIATALARARRP